MKKLPDITEILLNLDIDNINLLSDKLLNNLNNTQLKKIQCSNNFYLINKIRDADRRVL